MKYAEQPIDLLGREESTVVFVGLRGRLVHRRIENYIRALVNRFKARGKHGLVNLASLRPMLRRTEWTPVLAELLQPYIVLTDAKPARFRRKQSRHGSLTASASSGNQQGAQCLSSCLGIAT
jgi:hypothetical protein